MKRLSTGVLAGLIMLLCGLNAVAAPSNATVIQGGNAVQNEFISESRAWRNPGPPILQAPASGAILAARGRHALGRAGIRRDR